MRHFLLLVNLWFWFSSCTEVTKSPPYISFVPKGIKMSLGVHIKDASAFTCKHISWTSFFMADTLIRYLVLGSTKID